MSLRVWLPLNGTLDNQGLDDIEISSLGTINYNNSGKIGKAFISGGSSQTINGIKLNNNFNEIFNKNHTASIAVWIKPFGNHVHYNGTIVSSGNWNGQRWAFGVSQDNTKVDTLSDGYNIYIDCSIPVNEWTHLVSVYDNGISKVYKNGIYIGEITRDIDFNSDSSFTCIGRETYANGYFGFNGLINDVRIYDHALSPMEVKKISQGLVLHFPLNRNGWGQDNLIAAANNTIKGYQVSNFTKTTNVSVPEWGCNDAERAVGSGGSSPIVALLFQGVSTANTPYSYSVYIKNNHTTNSVSFTGNTGGWATRKSNGEIWLPPGESDQMIVENSVGNGTSFIQFNFRTKNAGDAFDFICWHYKIEIGEKTTRWCPPSDSDLYTQLGINNNIEYDISGYKNNGQKIGTLTYTLNTPKYILSSIFDTAAHINLPIYLGASNLISDYTLSFWINRNNTDTTSHHTIITGPVNAYINKGSSNIRFTWTHAISESNKATNTWAPSSYNINNSVWTHIALTFAEGLLKFYLNGEKVNTSDRTGTGQYIYGTRSSTIGSYYNEDESFVGQISDVRVYVTALSEDDIKKIYESNKLG